MNITEHPRSARAHSGAPGSADQNTTRPVRDAPACMSHRGSSSVRPSSVLDKGASVQFGNRLLQFGLGVHHDRPIPGDWFLDRLAGDKQEADALLAGLNRDLFAAVEQHKRTVTGAFADDRFPRRGLFLGEDAEWTRSAGERTGSLEHIRKGMPRGLDRKNLATARGHRDVEIARLGGDTIHGSTLAPKLTADNPNPGAVVIADVGNFGARDVLVPRRRH